MVLANDNFIGYTSGIITRYGVRWIEAAIVNPCWTNILVYYVEGDHGHRMGEELGKQQFRIVVRGTCLIRREPMDRKVTLKKQLEITKEGSAAKKGRDLLKKK